MTERLTEHNKTGWVLKLNDPQNEFEARQQLMRKFKLTCEKLGKLEDIMERLGINFVEDLEDEIKSLRVDKYVYKKDRDTWKRACELASETLKQVMGKPLWIGGNIPAPEVKDTEYFYQQAKTEGVSR